MIYVLFYTFRWENYIIRVLTLNGPKTHVKQRFLPLMPFLMVEHIDMSVIKR